MLVVPFLKPGAECFHCRHLAVLKQGVRGGTGLFLRVIFDVSWSVCSTCGIFAAIYKVNPSVSAYLVDTVDWSFSHLEILIGFSFFLFFTFVLLLFGQNCSCLQLYACLNPESQRLVVIPPPPTICSQNMQIFAFFFPNVFPKVLAVRGEKGKYILTATHQKLCVFAFL